MKSLRLAAVLAALPLAAGPSAAQANEFAPAMRGYMETEVAAWAADPLLIAAIRDQNARFGNISSAEIRSLDRTWQAEIGASARPTIEAVTGNAASDFLRARVDEAGGVIAEVFVMDRNGLNVASSGTTSDYWQGDEAKFSESFGRGARGVHVGTVEFDESAQAYLGQVSVAIADPDTGEPIGAITVGLNAEMLF